MRDFSCSIFVICRAPLQQEQVFLITMLGYPVATLPILTIIATIIDPPATVLNVVGDSASAMITSRVVDGKKWLEKKAS